MPAPLSATDVALDRFLPVTLASTCVPGLPVEGRTPVIIGGAATTPLSEAVPPPGAGLVTVILDVSKSVRSEGGTNATSVGPRNIETRVCVRSRTAEFGRKPEPLMTRTIGAPFA